MGFPNPDCSARYPYRKADMKQLAAIVIVATLVGCGGASKTTSLSNSPVSREGNYMFTANVPGMAVGGNLLVTADTAVLVENSSTCGLTRWTIGEFWVGCRTSSAQSAGGDRPFQAESFAILKFDRRNPAVATWTSTIAVPKTRRVCERYETRSGREVCASWKNETVYSTETKSGRVAVRRTP